YATPDTLTRGLLDASSRLSRRLLATVALSPVWCLFLLRRLTPEALLEVVERGLHAFEPPREVVRLPAEPVTLLLNLAQAALEILHHLGTADHEIAGARVDQPQRGAGADDEAEQQGEQKADDDHDPSPPSARVSARSPAPPRARPPAASHATAGRRAARRRPDRPRHVPGDSRAGARAPRRTRSGDRGVGCVRARCPAPRRSDRLAASAGTPPPPRRRARRPAARPRTRPGPGRRACGDRSARAAPRHRRPAARA